MSQDKQPEMPDHDEDGIANFISEAIGQADVEVLKDFENSGTLAEHFDVVTSSLLPRSATTSRRNSVQEEEDSGAKIDSEKHCDGKETIDESHHPFVRERKPAKQKVNGCDEVEKLEEELETSDLDTQKSQKIKNRLKIRLPLKSSADSKPKKKSVAKEIQQEAVIHHSSPIIGKVTKDTLETKPSSSSIQSDQQQKNVLLHDKCRRMHQDILEQEEQIADRIRPCCIIVYDILKTEKFLRFVTPIKQTRRVKSSGISINLCSITEKNTIAFHGVEKKYREFYSNILNKSNKQKINVDKTETNTQISKAPKNANTDPKYSDGITNKPEQEKLEKTKKILKCNQMQSPKKDGVKIAVSTSKESKPEKLEKLVPKRKRIIVEEEEEEDAVMNECEMSKRHKPVQLNVEPLQVSDTVKIEKSLGQSESAVRKERLDDNNGIVDVALVEIMSGSSLHKESVVEVANVGKTRREKDSSRREKDRKFEKLEKERYRKLSDGKKVSSSNRSHSAEKALVEAAFSPQKPFSKTFRIPKAPIDPNKSSKANLIQEIVNDEHSKHDKKEIPIEENWEESFTDGNNEDDRVSNPSSSNRNLHENFIEKQSQSFAENEMLEMEVRQHKQSEKAVSKSSCKGKPSSNNLADHVDVDESNMPIEVVIGPGDPVLQSPPKYIHQPDQSFSGAFDNSAMSSLGKNDQPVIACGTKVKDEAMLELDWGDDTSELANSTDEKNTCPISEVKIGTFTVDVVGLLEKNLKSKTCSTFNSFLQLNSSSDVITQKCAWWFSICDKKAILPEDLKLPALQSPVASNSSDTDSNTSLSGCLDASEYADKVCQVNEISSTSHRNEKTGGHETSDPDKVDEYCGRSLLQAQIRTASGHNFRNLFDLRAGALYEKDNFQAKCNLCNQLIIGKRELAKHIQGELHKNNLRKIDPLMDQCAPFIQKKSTAEKSVNKMKIKQEKIDLPLAEKKSKTKTVDSNVHSKKDKVKIKKEPGTENSSKKMKPEITKTSNECDPKRRKSKSPAAAFISRRRSRSRSHSKGRRRNSRTRSRSPICRIRRSPLGNTRRSPAPELKRRSRRSRSTSQTGHGRSRDNRHRRSKSRDRQSRRVKRSKSKSPSILTAGLKKDDREFHEKLKLTSEGRWTDAMENAWKLMEAEEAMFREQFMDKKNMYNATPEKHPKYGIEWTEFWEQRYQQVEREGKDPETYNYVAEWKEYWSKRLNWLLQSEADEQIQDIKKKYKMDFESLNSLRKLGLPQQQPIIQTQIGDPSRLAEIRMENISGHSSLGSNLVDTRNIMPNVGFDPQDVQQRRIPPVSVEDFKTTWEAFTRPKSEKTSVQSETTFVPEFSVTTPFSKPIDPPLSDSTSNSDASFDFMGFDIVQVLRLMTKAEDQLSFLAPKVNDFYKMAEELELKRNKGSHVLLENEELVTVLFQARDRFMTMIRSNVINRDILKTLNLAVFGLNAILDAPQCQKFRPKLPPTLPEIELENTPLVVPPKSEAIINPIDVALYGGDDFYALISRLSSKQKESIAAEVTKYMLLMGGQTMPNLELKEFVVNLITPLLKPLEPENPDIELAADGKTKLTSAMFDINREKGKHNLLGHDYTHSMDMRISGVSSTKVVGSALPALPSLYRNRESPEQSETFRRGISDNISNETFDSSTARGRRDNPDERRSPFSRRELAMNPVADRGRF